MSELELEIGRTLGPSAYFIYHIIKNNPGATQIDITIEGGFSWCTVQRNLIKLEEAGIVTYKLKEGTSRQRSYKENEAKETWKLH